MKTDKIYPKIGQSWGIAGIVILMMIFLMPLNYVLNEPLGKELSMFIYYLLTMGGAFFVVNQIRKKTTGTSSYNFGRSNLKVIALVFVSITAILFGITFPLSNLLPMPEFMRQMFLELSSQKGVFAFLTIVIAAPIFEELIFRGIVLDGLLQQYSAVTSIILSSLLFGLVHLNPWQFISAFVIGLFSGWVYYRTGKLSLSIFIHFVNNLMAFLSMLLSDNPEESMNQSLLDVYGGLSNAIFIITGAIVLLIVGIVLLRKEFTSSDADKLDKINHKEGSEVLE